MEVSLFEHVLFYLALFIEMVGYCSLIFAITKKPINAILDFIISLAILYFAAILGDILVLLTSQVIIKFILAALSIFIIIKFVLKESYSRTLLYFLITMFTSFISELLIYFVINFLFSSNAESLVEHSIINNLGLLLFTILLFTLVAVFNKETIKSILKSFSDIGNKINYQILIILIIFIPQIILIVLFKYDFSFVFLALTIVQLITILYTTSKYSNTLSGKIKVEQELKNVEIYNHLLTIHNEGIRGFKHDFNNIVQAIGGFISLNNMEGLKKYYKEGLLKECVTINTVSSLTPDMINEPAMYSIVASKYLDSSSKNITFKIETMCDVSEINMSKYELSRIIGILLDNAIEATAKAENKEVSFKIFTDYANNKDVIIIENTFVKSPDFNIDNIFKKDYSTKKVKSGFGLYEVKKLLDKTPQANIFTNCKNDKFSQTLMIDRIPTESEVIVDAENADNLLDNDMKLNIHTN